MTTEMPDVFTGDFWRDPYPAYATLREHAPVVEVALGRGGTTWLITRYDDVLAAFDDERLVKEILKTMPPGSADPRAAGSSMMLMVDPPRPHPAEQAGHPLLHRPARGGAAPTGA